MKGGSSKEKKKEGAGIWNKEVSSNVSINDKRNIRTIIY